MSILGNPITLGGGGLELVANVADGATVTAVLGSKTVTAVSSGGQARLKIPQEGKWTVSATSGLLVSVPQEISVPATIDIALVAQELNDTSWTAIKQVSDANMGANFWSVGDCKEITMNGMVSDGLTLSQYTTWVYIIGFNHNAEREGNGIAFQGFKATKDGTPICLTDSKYNSSVSSGMYFNMNNESINIGWEACQMRNNIMPLIKAAFPSDLQAVIKSSTIFTSQQSGGADCTATVDEVFLLAEYEVFGRRYYSSLSESNYLKQYTYYAAGNSKVMYTSTVIGNASYWWMRSPSSYNAGYFCSVTANGGGSSGHSNNVQGVSPAFKV